MFFFLSFSFFHQVISFLFLNSTGYGECLLDEPVSRPYTLSQQLPGQIYSVNKQCELIFGPGTQVCPYMVSGVKNDGLNCCVSSVEEAFRVTMPSFSNKREAFQLSL